MPTTRKRCGPSQFTNGPERGRREDDGTHAYLYIGWECICNIYCIENLPTLYMSRPSSRQASPDGGHHDADESIGIPQKSGGLSASKHFFPRSQAEGQLSSGSPIRVHWQVCCGVFCIPKGIICLAPRSDNHRLPTLRAGTRAQSARLHRQPTIGQVSSRPGLTSGLPCTAPQPTSADCISQPARGFVSRPQRGTITATAQPFPTPQAPPRPSPAPHHPGTYTTTSWGPSHPTNQPGPPPPAQSPPP